MEEREARILIYDIETSPLIGYTWGVWQQDVIEVMQDFQILSVAWRWYGESKLHVVAQDDFKGYKPGKLDDRAVVETLHKLWDEADIVIAHNGNQFDQKKVRARIAIHRLPPPSPFFQIDTKQVAQRYFGFTKNNLKDLAKMLGVEHQKGDPGGFGTWKGCLAGDVKAWKHMKKYNKQDIPPLEEIYTILRPWITNHPNLARITNRPETCPKCGQSKWESAGWRTTNVTRYRRYRCRNCGGYASQRFGLGKEHDVKPSYVNIPG